MFNSRNAACTLERGDYRKTSFEVLCSHIVETGKEKFFLCHLSGETR